MKVTRKIDGCFQGVLRVSQGSFKEISRGLKVSRLFQRSFNGVSWVFHIKGVSRKFQVSRVFCGRFKGVSRKFKENSQGVSTKFCVAWHS